MKCKVCKARFQPFRPLQKVCSIECALALGKATEAKKQAKSLRSRREALKPRSQWLREAQAAFNAWIRRRDADNGEACISCQRRHDGQWHAGHYISTGARPELRFDESNCHLQCQPCNTHLSGNLVLYRKNLIGKIGLAEVERLEGPQTPRKYTIDDLRKIRDDYRARMKIRA